MIDVILTKRAQQHKYAIASYRRKNLPVGTDDEVGLHTAQSKLNGRK